MKNIFLSTLLLVICGRSALSASFTDADLEKLLKNSKNPGIIYTWSPHMPLSLLGLKEAQKLAHENNWNFTAVVDPYTSPKLIQRSADKEHFPVEHSQRLESRKLLKLNLSLHYPSLITYQNGVLNATSRGGYDEPVRLKKYLANEFAKRKVSSLSSISTGPFMSALTSFPKMGLADTKSQPSEEVCRFAPFGVIQRTAPRRATSYFFRTFPELPLVSYAGVDDPNSRDHTKNHNYILNLNTRQEYQLTGPYDPVPICEDLMTVPTGSGFMKVLSIKKIMRGDQNPQVGVLPFGGVYQSVSACPDHGKGEVRIISDLDGASQMRLSVDTTGDTPTYEVIDGPKPICSNVDLKFPMLSKDGREISGRDEQAQTSKIWRIEADGTCTETFNFGSLLGTKDSKLAVGKADFSFDGKLIAFHVRSDEDEGNYFERASESMAMNIYVLNRADNTLRKITNNYNRNSYYPVFKRDGTLVYMDMTRDGQMSFIWIDPLKSPAIDFDFDFSSTTRQQQAKRYEALALIGRTWFELCADQKTTTTIESSVLTALSLDETECRDMVARHWKTYRKDVLSKTLNEKSSRAQKLKSSSLNAWNEEELGKFCPEETRIYKDLDVIGNLDDTVLQNAQGIIEAKCMGCHHPKAIDDPEVLINDRELLNKIMWRVFQAPPNQRMPLGGSLTAREQQTLKSYFQAYLDKQIKMKEPNVLEQGRPARLRAKRPKDLPSLNLGK